MANSPITIHAYAKLNLGLRVLGRRPDGYHELHTHLQTIDLYDTVTFSERGDDRIVLQTEPDLGVRARDNLVFRAAERFRAHTGLDGGVNVELVKRIPAGAGLGGGSSDAAATLVALDALFDTNHSPSDLHELAAELGSDVPFFLTGGFACAKGRGERLTPLPPRFEGVHFVLLIPALAALTPAVYRAWDEANPSGVIPELTCDDLPLHNDLQAPALRAYPQLRALAELVASAPTDLKGMTGSGSAFFVGFRAKPEADLWAVRIKEKAGNALRIMRCRSSATGHQIHFGPA